MKPNGIILWITAVSLTMVTTAWGAEPIKVEPRKATVRPTVHKAVKTKGPMNISMAFNVQQVTFKTISINTQTHLVAAVIFNEDIDAATVRQNSNIRLLAKNQNNFWVAASTQNNIVHIRPNFITWVCGAPLQPDGTYKMHLQGTIKSTEQHQISTG